mmetsp:Transcript_17082/g.30488  ORF Transcript_17082/g.30488 Transcript_17082/m.30488 type:complete len:135 (-) Transcript_17082:77-481(-)
MNLCLQDMVWNPFIGGCHHWVVWLAPSSTRIAPAYLTTPREVIATQRLGQCCCAAGLSYLQSLYTRGRLAATAGLVPNAFFPRPNAPAVRQGKIMHTLTGVLVLTAMPQIKKEKSPAMLGTPLSSAILSQLGAG